MLKNMIVVDLLFVCSSCVDVSFNGYPLNYVKENRNKRTSYEDPLVDNTLIYKIIKTLILNLFRALHEYY